ncbi:hypothetical protein LZ31DRAFT_50900 [Colletotrichum somersetense]|nr:hypothetical protein LZ31DRAFT_50900 [Colletotrichum somersetense]
MAALKKAMVEGNTAVTDVVRSIDAGDQGLDDNDEEPRPSQIQADEQSMTSDMQAEAIGNQINNATDEGYGEKVEQSAPRTESFPNSARKAEHEATETEDSSYRPVRELPKDVEAALTAQVSLLHQYTFAPFRPEKLPGKEPAELPPATSSELPPQERHSQQGKADESFGLYEFEQLTLIQELPVKTSEKPAFVNQPALQRASQAENIPSEPVFSPGQGLIRRKPAPSVSFGAAYAQNPTTIPSALPNNQYQNPPQQLHQRASFDHRPPYQNSASYPGAPAYQESRRSTRLRCSSRRGLTTPPTTQRLGEGRARTRRRRRRSHSRICRIRRPGRGRVVRPWAEVSCSISSSSSISALVMDHRRSIRNGQARTRDLT